MFFQRGSRIISRRIPLKLAISRGRGISTTKPLLRAGFAPIGRQNIVGYALLGLTAVGLWWNFYPHNPYPPSISKYLRKASWEEIKTKGYEKSIEYYKEALVECDKLDYSPLDDKLTGIEIKIAEMYERLGNKSEETKIYLSLLEKLYNGVKFATSEEEKVRLMKRDLSVLIKMVENMDANATVKRNFLQMHINLVQGEFEKSVPSLSHIMAKGNENIFMNTASPQYKSLMKDVGETSKHFGNIRDEFLMARDLHTDICRETNMIDDAIHTKMITIGWMVLMGMDQEDVLMSQANLAGLMYMKAENVEYSILKLKDGEKTEANDKTIEMLSQRYKHILAMSESYYQTVLDKSKLIKASFPVGQGRDAKTLQVTLLSLYGLGVINLHRGDNEMASRFLNQSKILAEEYDFLEMLEECNRELKKLPPPNIQA